MADVLCSLGTGKTLTSHDVSLYPGVQLATSELLKQSDELCFWWVEYAAD